MKRHARHNMHTLAELITTVSQLAHNQHLGAYIVADMINSRLVKVDGAFHGKRIVIR
ncbi:MAG: hypothetical protein ABSC38_04465 [Verrucomicrobiia bacterium]